MTSNSDKAKQIYLAIQKALIEEWDPIGVRDVPEAQGEYDSYVPMLYDLLLLNKPDEEIFDYLWWVETEHMGLNGEKKGTEDFIKRLRYIFQIINNKRITKKNIETKWSELRPLGNILNELCHGIYLEDIEKETGCKKEAIYTLLIKIAVCETNELKKEDILIIELDDFEIGIIKSCFLIVENEIEDRQYQARIGVSKEEANQILNKLNESFKEV